MEYRLEKWMGWEDAQEQPTWKVRMYTRFMNMDIEAQNGLQDDQSPGGVRIPGGATRPPLIKKPDA